MAGANANDPLEGVKTWWRKLTPQNRWLIGGGAGVVLVLIIAAASSGGNEYPANGPYGRGYPGQAYQGGYPGQGYEGQEDGGQGGAPGYAGYPGQGGVGQDGGGAGGQGGDDPTGYWERQRVQEQQSRAFSGHMRDTNTVQDNQTGDVYTDVPNAYADPAIGSGAYSQVPTSELPTTTPAPAETAAPAE